MIAVRINFEDRLVEARHFFRDREFAPALEKFHLCEAIARTDDDYSIARRGSGLALLNLGRFIEADAALRQARRKSSDKLTKQLITRDITVVAHAKARNSKSRAIGPDYVRRALRRALDEFDALHKELFREHPVEGAYTLGLSGAVYCDLGYRRYATTVLRNALSIVEVRSPQYESVVLVHLMRASFRDRFRYARRALALTGRWSASPELRKQVVALLVFGNLGYEIVTQ